jgi:hypothetical protein
MMFCTEPYAPLKRRAMPACACIFYSEEKCKFPALCFHCRTAILAGSIDRANLASYAPEKKQNFKKGLPATGNAAAVMGQAYTLVKTACARLFVFSSPGDSTSSEAGVPLRRFSSFTSVETEDAVFSDGLEPKKYSAVASASTKMKKRSNGLKFIGHELDLRYKCIPNFFCDGTINANIFKQLLLILHIQ